MTAFKVCPTCGGKYLGFLCPVCGGPQEKTAPKASRRPGESIRGYRILEEIGRGGMGTVYKARKPAGDGDCALKILEADPGDLALWERRLRREGAALAALRHPNIVSLVDFGNEDGILFLITEYVRGTSLRPRIARGPLSLEETRRIAAEVSEGLAFAHDRGVIHRDLKPENILIDFEGRVKILDFGLAKTHGPGLPVSLLTRSGETLGTAAYLAPEQVEGSSEVDPRCDIFSLGVVTFEMLTGKLPLGDLVGPSQHVAVPPSVDRAIGRALSHDPNGRQAGIRDFAKELIAC